MHKPFCFSFVALISVGALAGCSSDNAEGETFDNVQECVDEHSMTESLSVPNSITICILDHVVIGGKHLEFATTDECEAYIGDNLEGYDPADITAGCEDYIVKKDQ